MLSLPSPLHPAVVHFPIVLILLGTLVAVAAAFTSRWHVRLIAAIVLTLGTLGTMVATSTGEEDGEAVEHVAATSALLDAHETWAERTLWISAAAAVLAIAAALTTRWLLANRALGAICALGALVASYCVYETGHRGGQLVYRHGAGVNLAPATATSTASAVPAARAKSKHREHDDQ
jgi:uncharacterized membrane protein